jgi:transcriptional regulator with XRE-family HTH domain
VEVAAILKNIIGERVRAARMKEKPKVTQLDLLARLEIRGIYLEKTAISKIETGTRPVSDKELVAIADALRVTPNWLLKIEN